MVKLVDLLLDQTFGFIFNAFWWGRRHNHLVIIMVWVILQRVLSISQAPMFKVNIIFLCFRDNRERVFPWRNSINFLCYAIDSAPGGHCKIRGIEGSYFCHDFLKPSFSSKHMTFPTSRPAIPVLRRGIFFEKSLRPHRSHHQSMTPCLLQWRFPAALGKVSGTSFEVFVSPFGPWCPAGANMFAKFGWVFFWRSFEVSSYGFNPHASAPGAGHLGERPSLPLDLRPAFFVSHPSIRIYSVYSFWSDMLFPKKQHTWTTDAAQCLHCIRCHKKKKVTAGQDHSEKEW